MSASCSSGATWTWSRTSCRGGRFQFKTSWVIRAGLGGATIMSLMTVLAVLFGGLSSTWPLVLFSAFLWLMPWFIDRQETKRLHVVDLLEAERAEARVQLRTLEGGTDSE